jgi:plastocyanin
MTGNLRAQSFEGIVAPRRAAHVEPLLFDRRHALRLMGGAGLAAAAMLLLRDRASAHQESASPMAGPQVGPQPDGTTLWKVIVGGMDMENMIEYHAFLPGEITINAGDSIWFAEEMPMFHTVTFLGPDQVPPFFIPDPEEAATGTPVAGPPKLLYNPLLFAGTGDTAVDGSKLVSTSLDIVADPSKPWVFSFPQAGTYDYVCVPHSPVMQGRVIVQEAGSALAMDQAAYDAAAQEQLAALREQGLAEIEKYSQPVSTQREDGTTLWEVAAGAGGFSAVRVQRFLPGEIEVKVGDTIKFVNQSPAEPHTVSYIGAGETAPEDLIIEAFADGSPKFVQNPITYFPQGGNAWTGAGWLTSGFMGAPDLGWPMEFEVTYEAEGEFIHFCRLHGNPDGTGMAGKVAVKAAS